MNKERMREIIKECYKVEGGYIGTRNHFVDRLVLHPEMEALLDDSSKYISPTECPTCARGSEKFELTNHPDTYMCDGCGLTRGSIVGKWNGVFDKLIKEGFNTRNFRREGR